MSSDETNEIKIARLEERLVASDKALELARNSVSRASLVSFITIILSIVALIISILRVTGSGVIH